MGVGSVGEALLPYEECDTYLSTDAGVTWNMIAKDAHKYEFGDQGSILVVINDEDRTDSIRYSLDLGKTWWVLFRPLSLNVGWVAGADSALYGIGRRMILG
jgi:hypothetical protein